MSFSDEILMAYADGELEPALAAQVEQAMRTDPQVAAAVQRHRALRADVFAAFAGALDEPVPERLQPRPAAKAREPGLGARSATVVQLDAVRAVREPPAAPPRAWLQWGALAASLVIGVLAGALGWQGLHADGGNAPFRHQGGTLVAQGQLADALSRRLAGAPAGGDAVKLGTSFQARDGSYCRSFTLGATGGLACRDGGQWRIPVLAEGEPEQAGAYRQAGSALPAAVLDAIDQRIAGAALDAQAERAARDRGWRR
jgi:hypothetical protein